MSEGQGDMLALVDAPSCRSYTLKGSSWGEDQLAIITQALVEFEERQADHGSPRVASLTFEIRRKLRRNLTVRGATA